MNIERIPCSCQYDTVIKLFVPTFSLYFSVEEDIYCVYVYALFYMLLRLALVYIFKSSQYYIMEEDYRGV